MARAERDQRPETLSALFDLYRIELNEVPRPGRQHGGSRSRLWCPQCGGGPSKERNFFVVIDADGLGAAWICFRANHCGFQGGGRLAGAIYRPSRQPRLYRRPTPPSVEDIQRPAKFLRYFAELGIGEATLQYFGVYRTLRRMPVLDASGQQTDRRQEMPVIVYPYRDDGTLTNRKFKAVYAAGKKRFEQEAECEPTLFNIDSFTDPSAGYFVEGENDCLAMFEAGFRQVTTVPNGAPPKIAAQYDPATDEDERYAPLRPGDERIDRVERWFLAGDMDPAGLRHMEEVARRLGKHRCWLVRWPPGCKDATDTLRQGGPEAVRQAVARALAYPLPGVQEITEATILKMYASQDDWVYTTGYPSLDERLRLSDEGLFICTTGIPGHGKTAFWASYAGMVTLRQEEHMMHNVALRPFHTVILSAEMPNPLIARDLISLHARKPFYPVSGQERVESQAVQDTHLPWVRRHFTFLFWENMREQPTMSWVWETLIPVVKQTGAKLAIVDPWQEFDDEMPPHWRQTTSRWIAKVLREARAVAWELKINLVLVAHPMKMKRDKSGNYAVPGGYDIAESQAFASVPEVGLTVHRPHLGQGEDDNMDLHCWKMRDHRFGRVGSTSMRFDPYTHCLWPRPQLAQAAQPGYGGAAD